MDVKCIFANDAIVACQVLSGRALVLAFNFERLLLLESPDSFVHLPCKVYEDATRAIVTIIKLYPKWAAIAGPMACEISLCLVATTANSPIPMKAGQ